MPTSQNSSTEEGPSISCINLGRTSLQRPCIKHLRFHSGTAIIFTAAKSYGNQYKQSDAAQSFSPARANAKFAAIGSIAQSLIVHKSPRLRTLALISHDRGARTSYFERAQPPSINARRQAGKNKSTARYFADWMKQAKDMVLMFVIPVSSSR